MENLNESLAVHAVQLLTACYFPGVLAAYIQLFRGTKYSRFPNWLDRWLKMRKQLGLLMLFSACLHVSPVNIPLFQTRLEILLLPGLLLVGDPVSSIRAKSVPVSFVSSAAHRHSRR